MVKYIKKDITTIEEGVIVHGVNCQGVMGSGVAKAIRNKWPEVFKVYRELSVNEFYLGKTQIVKITEDPNLFVINCFTQKYYGSDGALYADVQAVRETLGSALCYTLMFDLDLYMPRIGCGLGGLDWDTDVNPIVEEFSKSFATTIYVCDLP